MDILQTKFNFNHLSVRDLVEARDLFHVHLINKKNVVATAIGRYRIRKSDPWPNEKSNQDVSKPRNRGERTLENSEVRDYSWPCILVFVTQWSDEKISLTMARATSSPITFICPMVESFQFASLRLRRVKSRTTQWTQAN